jgi:hypothetical protein
MNGKLIPQSLLMDGGNERCANDVFLVYGCCMDFEALRKP